MKKKQQQQTKFNKKNRKRREKENEEWSTRQQASNEDHRLAVHCRNNLFNYISFIVNFGDDVVFFLNTFPSILWTGKILVSIEKLMLEIAVYRNAASESLAFLQGNSSLFRKWRGVLYADYFAYLKLQKWKRWCRFRCDICSLVICTIKNQINIVWVKGPKLSLQFNSIQFYPF